MRDEQPIEGDGAPLKQVVGEAGWIGAVLGWQHFESAIGKVDDGIAEDGEMEGGLSEGDLAGGTAFEGLQVPTVPTTWPRWESMEMGKGDLGER